MPSCSKVAKPKTKVNRQPNRNIKVGAEPATVLKVQDAASMIVEGKSRATIIQTMMDKYGIGYDTAKHYYGDGVKFLLPEDEDAFRKELWIKNISRLEEIIERGMTDNTNLKVAREAIAEINKMLGVYRDGVTVGVRTDLENNTQEFVIKIND